VIGARRGCTTLIPSSFGRPPRAGTYHARGASFRVRQGYLNRGALSRRSVPARTMVSADDRRSYPLCRPQLGETPRSSESITTTREAHYSSLVPSGTIDPLWEPLPSERINNIREDHVVLMSPFGEDDHLCSTGDVAGQATIGERSDGARLAALNEPAHGRLGVNSLLSCSGSSLPRLPRPGLPVGFILRRPLPTTPRRW
jgi:hypothetical protein